MESILVELVRNKFIIYGEGVGFINLYNEYKSEGEPDFFILVTDEEIEKEEVIHNLKYSWKLDPDIYATENCRNTLCRIRCKGRTHSSHLKYCNK